MINNASGTYAKIHLIKFDNENILNDYLHIQILRL